METIRTLLAEEIECRVSQCKESNGKAWCTLLLYKDARVDQRLLDEVFGPMNWKREHQMIGDRLYCTVSIWNSEIDEWISKQDVGTESNTEKEKGQASDAFKRACFNWGIGRELYTAPTIFINLEQGEYKASAQRCVPSIRFKVKSIGYDDKRNITSLVITDNKGNVKYSLGKQTSAPIQASAPTPVPAPAPAPKKVVRHRPKYDSVAWKSAVENQAKGNDITSELNKRFVLEKEDWERLSRDVEDYKINNNLK